MSLIDTWPIVSLFVGIVVIVAWLSEYRQQRTTFRWIANLHELRR